MLRLYLMIIVYLFNILKEKRGKKVANDVGSPMVEEGLLIALAIIIFIAIVSIVSDIMNWLNDLYTEISSSEGMIYAGWR